MGECGDRGERQHWQLSSCPHGLPDLRMGSFWERNVSEIFFSEYAEDYQHQQPPALEEETDGFVCVSPDSGDSELETFIDDEYDICADAIEEIENLKREEEHFAQPEIDEVNNGEQQLATFKVPENKAVAISVKRRRPEVSESDLDTPSSIPSTAILTSTKRQKIGNGSFGQVYKIEENGKTLAVKEISALDPKAKREQDMLETVQHKHIIKYVRTFTDGNCLNIVMEYADLGSLHKLVTTAARGDEMLHLFDEKNIWRFLNQMSSALDYLHCKKPRRILHRDLKPDNILVVSTSNSTPNFQFKLADFGLAKLLTADAKGEHYASTRCGTPRYMAPEVTSNWRKYSFGADIFSLGCILVFYANQGKHLFYNQDEVNKWQGVMDDPDNEVLQPGRYSTDLVEIIGKMLRVDQEERPSAKEILNECTKTRMMVKSRMSYFDPQDPEVFESLQQID